MKLNAPEGVASCSWNGESYKVKKGVVTVPDEALADLLEHGFTPVVPTDEDVKAANIAAAQQAVAAAQGNLDSETDPDKKAELEAALEEAKEALAALEG